MNRFIEKLNFKRIFICYIIFAAAAAICFGGAAAHLNRDKLLFAAGYISAGLSMETGDIPSEQIGEMAEISMRSESVPDILILDSDNTVRFSTSPELAREGMNFTPRRSLSGFLEGENGYVYRAVDKSDFILASLLPIDLTDISELYRDEYFLNSSFDPEALYLISYMGGDADGNKVCIASPAASMGAGPSAVKAAAAAAVFVFMIYWLLAALWVYKNALRSGLAAPFWGIAVLITNVVGIVIYELYKHSSAVCPYCGAVQAHGGVFCVRCGKKLLRSCADCGGAADANDRYCRHCGSEMPDEK